MSDEARLGVVFDPSGAIEGAAKVRQAASDVTRSLGDIRNGMKHLRDDSSVASNQLKELAKSADFSGLDSAKEHLGSLSRLKEYLNDIMAGYHDLRKEAKAFIEENQNTGIYKTKSGQQSLNDLSKELDQAGKELEKFGGDVDKAMDQASKSVQKHESAVGKSASGIMTWLKRMLGAYLSFRGVKSFIGSILRETTESESADSALEAALKATGHAAGITASEIKTMAKELQGVTVHSDEAITSMSTLLLTFRNVKGDTFKRANAAIIDMAEALKMDLNSAAQMVGRALDQPLQGMDSLGRSGVRLSESQKKLIKSFAETGQVAKAQEVILKALEDRYKDAATAARNTLGGALQALKVAWRDFFEMDADFGAFVRLRKAIEELISALKTDTVQRFKIVIGDLAAGVLEKLALGLKFVAGHADTLGAVLGGIITYKFVTFISQLLSITSILEKLKTLSNVLPLLGKSVVANVTAFTSLAGIFSTLLATGFGIGMFIALKKSMSDVAEQAGKTQAAILGVNRSFANYTTEQMRTEVDKHQKELMGLNDALSGANRDLRALVEQREALEKRRKESVSNKSDFLGLSASMRSMTSGTYRQITDDLAKTEEKIATAKQNIAELENKYQREMKIGSAMVELLRSKEAGSVYDVSPDVSTGTGTGKSAIQRMIEDMRNQINYLNKDGANFLPTLEKMLGKTKLLDENWRAIKDFLKEIHSGGLAKIQDEVTYKGITGEEYLPELKELQKRFADLSPEWIAIEDAIRSIEDRIHDSTLKKFSDRLKSSSVDFDDLISSIRLYKEEVEKIENPDLREAKKSQIESIEKSAYDQKWSDVAWKFNQGFLESVGYAKLLREEIAGLAEGTEAWKDRYAELQSVTANEMDKTVRELTDSFGEGEIELDEYKSVLQTIIDKFGVEFPLVAEIAQNALDNVKEPIDELREKTEEWTNILHQGLVDAIVDGKDFGGVLEDIGREMVKWSLNQLLFGPGGTGGLLGGLFGGFGFARGGVIDQGNYIKKYASGGVVSSPTIFPMRNGMGLMGEDGAEGIFPLKRMPNGDLGVQASQARVRENRTAQAPTVVLNVENKSDGAVSAKQTSTKWNEGTNKIIVNAVIENIASNGQIAQMLKQRR
ncbi:MAG: phage tail length tape measure family protein [Synergistaceae bacterium]|nr:phage tail length tape measure family protein [Synergistaceae bacterium]